MCDKFTNAKIYGITNTMDGEIYIGSTVRNLSARFNRHKRNVANAPRRNIYKHMIAVGVNNCKIELLEEYPCGSRLELRQREQFWIDELSPSLNKRQAYTTDEQKRVSWAEYMRRYRNDNPDKIKEIQKRMYDKNRDKIAEKITCECGRVITKKHHVKHKQSKLHNTI